MSRKHPRAALLVAVMTASSSAHASLFSGDTLDKVADILAWIVLIAAPIIAVAVFWLVHILPERIAEQRHHPQAAAIKTLCLLSLFFGGLLWPIAWLWAYSKPVLYKMAYGVDTVKHGESEASLSAASTPVASNKQTEPEVEEVEEVAGVGPATSRATVRERRPWES